MIGVEELSDEELAIMKEFFGNLSTISKSEKYNKIHTIDKEKETREKEEI